MANLRIATTESWRDKQTGEQQERTEWHRVALFGRLAEIAAEYLRKGSQVYIEGSLRTRKWQDKQGNERYSTEIVGNEMQMLGGRGGGRRRWRRRGAAASGGAAGGAPREPCPRLSGPSAAAGARWRGRRRAGRLRRRYSVLAAPDLLPGRYVSMLIL